MESTLFQVQSVVPIQLINCRSISLEQSDRELSKLPIKIREWLRHEQELLDRSVDTKRIVSPTLNDQQEEFTPEAGEVFELNGYWLDSDRFEVFVAKNCNA